MIGEALARIGTCLFWSVVIVGLLVVCAIAGGKT